MKSLRELGGAMLRLLPILLIILIGVAGAQKIDFHVSLLGDGKLHPGDDTTITILIENEAKISGFTLNENTSDLLNLITTAKDVRVELSESYLPITVETVNPQLIGDIPSGKVAQASFRIRVDENAELGEYKIPVKIRYTKVTYTFTSTGVDISYRDDFSTEYVKIEITKKDYNFDVLSVKSALRTNSKGVVEVTIKNTGRFKIYDAILRMNASTPLSPDLETHSVYLGDLDVDRTAKASFKIYVMDGAISQEYPAELILAFRKSDGSESVLTKKIGIKVENKDTFDIKEIKSFLTSSKTVQSNSIPSRGFLSVKIKANENMKDAIALLSFDTPLLQAENSPYIGDLSAGEDKEVTFYIKSTAPVGIYRGSLTLKYKNDLGDEIISEKHYIEVVVGSSPLKVEKVETKNLGVGMRGDIAILIKSTHNITNAEFAILPPPSITPLSPAYYTAVISTNETKEIKFRVSVSNEIISGSYKIYLIGKFSLDSVEDLVSISEFPIIVKPKAAYFEVISVEGTLYPDSTGEIIVKIKNIGDTTIYNGVAELTVSPPLTIAGGSSISSLIGVSQPGLYFVGTLKPNDVAVAKFRIDVDKDAGAGFYPITIKIKYDDEEGYTHESSPITASVEVKEGSLINPLTVSVIILVLIAVIAGVKFAKKRKL